MRNIIPVIMVTIFITLLQSCNTMIKEDQGVPQDNNFYNLCLILDGTDRLAEQNGVPEVTIEEIMEITECVSEKGKGTLYVSYVDNNCDNNHVAIYEWLEDKPLSHGEKSGYMKMSEYKKLEKADVDKQEAYNHRLTDALEEFSRKCLIVRDLAYSDAVALQKNGSDVNGAINQAIKLLRASAQEGIHSYIILVSDGCDNVGKEQEELSPGTELIIVNSNVLKHQYQKIVSREFVTLRQAINYIFS